MNHLPYCPSQIPGLTVQKLADETLLYDESSHRAFCLNRMAGLVWDSCDGTRTVSELARDVSQKAGIPVSETIIDLALKELDRDGLLEPVGDRAGWSPAVASTVANPISSQVSRRTMLTGLGLGAASLVPAVAMIFTPKAAQAYSGCFTCAPAGTPVHAAAIERRQAAVEAQRKARGKNDSAKRQSGTGSSMAQ